MIDTLENIICPHCEWKPGRDSIWRCSCDHRWNTFDTGGLCPACHKQWNYTVCLSCYTQMDHIEWYKSIDKQQPFNSDKVIRLFAQQYSHAFALQEPITDRLQTTLYNTLKRRLDEISHLRQKMHLSETNLVNLYEYYLNNRPISLGDYALQEFDRFTEGIKKRVEEISGDSEFPAKDYLYLIGAPIIYIENAHVLQERIDIVNRMLREGGYPQMTTAKTEELLLKILTIQPEGEKISPFKKRFKEVLEDSNFANRSESQEDNEEISPSDHIKIVGLDATAQKWAERSYAYWKKIIDEEIVHREEVINEVKSVILERMKIVNNLRKSMQLWIYNVESFDDYFVNNQIDFDFWEQKFKIDDFKVIDNHINSKIEVLKFTFQEVDIECFFLAIGRQLMYKAREFDVQSAFDIENLERLAKGINMLTNLEKEEMLVKILNGKRVQEGGS